MGTDEDRGTQGCAWTSQAGAAVSNPFTSKLVRDCEKPIAHSATQMALLRPEIFLKNTGLRLVSKRRDVVKNHLQDPLARFFSTTHPAFARRIKPVLFSVFLFDSFAPAHLALRANLRLLYRAPAPVLGCVYPSYPWLKSLLPIRVN
jgi:hypothetical protein